MEPLGKILKHNPGTPKPKTPNDHSLEQSTNSFLAMKYWDEVVNAFIAGAAGKSKAVAVEHDTLVIACLSEDFAREVAELQDTFIEGINRLLGHDYIKAIRLEL